MKIAVYTCVTGGYDRVSTPKVVDPRLDYHCWSDEPKSIPAPWQAHLARIPGLDAKDTNRYIKMHPHLLPELAGCDASVYLDGSIEIVGDLHALVADCLARPESIFLYDHPFRHCAYDEASVCASVGHVPLWTLRRQMARYRRAGFPADAGLYECGVIVRRHTPDLAETMSDWWAEYLAGARRDQLSFTWVAWRRGLQVGSLGASDPRFTQRVLRLKPHLHAAGFSPRAAATKWINRALQHSRLVRLPSST